MVYAPPNNRYHNGASTLGAISFWGVVDFVTEQMTERSRKVPI